MTRRQATAWLPAVAYMALIWLVSSLDLASPPLDVIPLGDKGVHFVEYGILGFLLAHAALRTWPDRHVLRAASLALLITMLWGWLDEIHQAFVPGRASDVLDLVADLAGGIAGTSARTAAGWLRGGRFVESKSS